MSFHNVQLDPAISRGTEGGPTYSTTIQTTASGHEYRVQRASQPRHRHRFEKNRMTNTEWAALIEFFHARRGNFHGFRFKDWRDFSTHTNGTGAPTALDEAIGTGDGSETDFQLFAEYDPAGLNPYIRTLSCPVAGTILVAVAGTPTGSFTITNPGGLITLDTAPGGGQIVTAGCYFDTPVRFASDEEWLRLRMGGVTADVPLEVVELLDEVETPELWYPGGSAGSEDADGWLEVSQDFHITLHNKLWPIDPTAPVDAFLPPPDRLPGGADIFVVSIKPGAASDCTVRDDAGNDITGALSSGETRTIALARAGSTATWIAY